MIAHHLSGDEYVPPSVDVPLLARRHRHISDTSRISLGYTSAMHRLCIGYASAIHRLHLRYISAISRLPFCEALRRSGGRRRERRVRTHSSRRRAALTHLFNLGSSRVISGNLTGASHNLAKPPRAAGEFVAAVCQTLDEI